MPSTWFRTPALTEKMTTSILWLSPDFACRTRILYWASESTTAQRVPRNYAKSNSVDVGQASSFKVLQHGPRVKDSISLSVMEHMFRFELGPESRNVTPVALPVEVRPALWQSRELRQGVHCLAYTFRFTVQMTDAEELTVALSSIVTGDRSLTEHNYRASALHVLVESQSLDYALCQVYSRIRPLRSSLKGVSRSQSRYRFQSLRGLVLIPSDVTANCAQHGAPMLSGTASPGKSSWKAWL